MLWILQDRKEGKIDKMLENNNTGHEPEYLAICMCAILSCLGGIARELSNFESCFNLKRFISTMVTASFSGIIIGLFLPDFDHKNWVLACAGVSGVVGVSILDYFSDIFKAILKHIASSAIGHEIEVKERAKRIYKNKKKTK